MMMCLHRYVCYLAVPALLILASGCTATATTERPFSGSTNRPAVDLFLLSVDAQRAYQESRWIEAVRLYQQIVEHVPADAAAWFQLANTYAQQGAFKRAIHAYEQSLTHDTEQHKAWFNLSTAYLLHAQSAMRQSRARMQAANPSRAMIDQRLIALDDIVHGRLVVNEFTRLRAD